MGKHTSPHPLLSGSPFLPLLREVFIADRSPAREKREGCSLLPPWQTFWTPPGSPLLATQDAARFFFFVSDIDFLKNPDHCFV